MDCGGSIPHNCWRNLIGFFRCIKIFKNPIIYMNFSYLINCSISLWLDFPNPNPIMGDSTLSRKITDESVSDLFFFFLLSTTKSWWYWPPDHVQIHPWCCARKKSPLHFFLPEPAVYKMMKVTDSNSYPTLQLRGIPGQAHSALRLDRREPRLYY